MLKKSVIISIMNNCSYVLLVDIFPCIANILFKFKSFRFIIGYIADNHFIKNQLLFPTGKYPPFLAAPQNSIFLLSLSFFRYRCVVHMLLLRVAARAGVFSPGICCTVSMICCSSEFTPPGSSSEPDFTP